MSRKEKNPVRACILHVALSVLVTFVAMLLSSTIVSAVLNEFDNQVVKTLISDVIMLVVYAVSFYKFHQNDRINTYARHEGAFDVKAEILAYLRGEGKYLFILFAICAVLREVFGLIPGSFVSLFGVIFVDILLNPIVNFLHIPVLSSFIAFLYACALLCLLVVIRSRRIHRDDVRVRR
ncbi:MAG: hypothetical protein E7610_00595 [Ruminococcaceae bacterium]|nr:hypothetical protein [Oscillospiraceae bacterium]